MEHAEVSEQPVQAGADGERITVLYVDPAEDAATVEERQVASGQITVEPVQDADAALDRLAAVTFDCVVSEYAVQGVSGHPLFEPVRTR